MAEKQERTQAPKDIEKIIRYLSNTFNTVIKDLEKPSWTTAKGANDAYQMQTEFAYLIHEIMMCAPCVVQKNISACNDFIDQLVQKVNK